MYKSFEADQGYMDIVPSNTGLVLTKEDLWLIFSSAEVLLYVKKTDNLLFLADSMNTLISLPVTDKSFNQSLALFSESMDDMVTRDDPKVIALLKYIKLFDKEIFNSFIDNLEKLVSKINKPEGLPFIPFELLSISRKFTTVLKILKRL